MKTIFRHILITGGFLSLMNFIPAQEITVPLRFDRYYDYEELVEAMKALNRAYPRLTHLDLVGKSEENREIWALTINNPQTGNELDKPGVYVDGNIHGNEVQAGEVCLYFADYLLKNYGKNPRITALVDKNAYYVVPSVNVDGRYHFFNDPNTPSTNRGLRRPHDDDRDGLFDEDFPDDLDGDGNICNMRKRDPFGQYRTDPLDPRLMIPVKPGEPGEWTLLGQEGIDNDGDGQVNEDSEGYVDPNRNWPYNWEPPYVQRGSDNYPLSGVGLKALASYITDRPNIIMAFAFHNNGGMFLRGPGTEDQGDFPRNDVEVFDYLGKNAEKIVPGYRYLLSWRDLYSTYGDFGDFMDNIVGAYTFVGELYRTDDETYRSPAESQKQEDEEGMFRENTSRTKERLEFNDHVVHGDLYKEWTPYNHPTYGEIEIGGWVKMSSRLPHPFMLPDLVHRNAAAVIFASGQTPEIKLEVTETEKIDRNLFRVTVRLSNRKAIPSLTYHAVQKKIHEQDILKVHGKQIRVVSGGILTDSYRNRVVYKEHKPEIQFLQVPGFGKIEYQFLVSGKGEMQVEYSSLKAGKIQKTVSLK
ncbi:MAG: M14 family metallopeptidase [Bacteroidales bacterium]